MSVHTDSTDHRLQLAVRAADQLLRHALDPYRVPRYLGCDDSELPSDYTMGMPEELDA
jgi:hypothetical protein